MVAKGSEAIFATTQPYRYAMYAAEGGRPEGKKRLEHLADGEDLDAAWADIALSFMAANEDRSRDALDFARRAKAADPDLPNVFYALKNVDGNLGHDENLRADLLGSSNALALHGAEYWTSGTIEPQIRFDSSRVMILSGDYRDAFRQLGSGIGGSLFLRAIAAAAMHDRARALDAANRLVRAETGLSDTAEDAFKARTLLAIDVGNWNGALDTLQNLEIYARALEKKYRAGGAFSGISAAPEMRIFVRPWSAYVLARTRQFAKAEALLSGLPADCDICGRMRGRVAALRHDWRTASWWFVLVAARSPDIPFAETDWGQMLLLDGKPDEAIAKFALVHAKGPHFADPLEMWGEALMQKNRSDLALAKFEEANKYAPNWGRLHLKWGTALSYLGKRAEAKQQFAIAARLDLSRADAAVLARARPKHV
ncbi:MAG TPA: hypothetical protein VHX61_17875 [Rhizomicrobium sp.]|nr:hypothetical protein [Rhizomicrobium sp.]